MSRRDRHGWRDRSGEGTSRGGPQEWRGRIESLLAAGKTREAVDAAKQWFKETRGLEAEALLAEAYEARLHALMARGLHEEARELATRLRERFVPYRDRFAEAVRWSEMLSGKLETLLAELTSATPPRRREIEAALTRKLTDPGVLADSTILPPDDPLRQGARLVVDLFGAVTSGPLPDGALARRRSWRISCFTSKRDERGVRLPDVPGAVAGGGDVPALRGGPGAAHARGALPEPAFSAGVDLTVASVVGGGTLSSR